MLRFEKYFFYLLLLLALSIIILPRFYITGDGASHTYNARVLFDFVFDHSRTFYEPYFQINRNLDPNWTGHLVIGTLLQVFPYWLADKLFQITYVLVFAFGFRYLIRSVHPENSFLSFLFFPFLFTLAFQEGFYNYSLAIGFFFWTSGYYLRVRHDFDHPVHQWQLSLLLLLTSFSHGMAALFALLLITCLWLSDHIRLLIPFDYRRLRIYASQLLLVMMPSLLMIALFLVKRGAGTEAHPWGLAQKIKSFLQFYGSQSTRYLEVYPAMACSLLCLAYFVWLIVTRIQVHREKKRKEAIVFASLFALTLLMYLTCPHSVGGAGSLDIRLVFLPPIFLLLYFATKRWTDLAKHLFIVCSFLISISFSIIRLPYIMHASRIGKEIMSASPYIRDESVVLNLHFDYWQRLSTGDSLFQQDGSFLHFSDFLGAEKNKHLIMLNNYEAEINYFPVNWQAGMNPRQTVAGFIQGELPPCGDYHFYEQQSKRRIDYILFQNWRADALGNPCVKQLLHDIDEDFDKVYDSPHHYIVVFQRKS